MSFFMFLFRGLPSQSFEYIKYNKGLMKEEDYPYKSFVWFFQSNIYFIE